MSLLYDCEHKTHATTTTNPSPPLLLAFHDGLYLQTLEWKKPSLNWLCQVFCLRYKKINIRSNRWLLVCPKIMLFLFLWCEVCVYVCMCVCVYICVCTYTCVCMYVCASVCICVCMCFISNYLILHFENDFTKFVVLLPYFDGTKCEKFLHFC